MTSDHGTFAPTALQIVRALRNVGGASHHVVECCIDRGYLNDQHELTTQGRHYLAVLDPKE